MGICAASLVLFTCLGLETPLWYVLLCLVIVGFGFGLFSSPNTHTIMSSVGPQDLGIASSVQSTSRSLGQVIGMALITIIANLVMGSAQITDVPKETIVRDMHISFIVFAALCVAGVLFSLGSRKRKA
ncbi:MAG: MFS transporter, partial [Clostridiales Family XIII bacterium]|jgi:MFS family permease|nr:MFS transporter [Clostridiales Family XIII bacterium]